MDTIIASILVLSGSFFCMLSAIGCLTMKDTYARMHVATKSVAFGDAMIVLAHCFARPVFESFLFGALVIWFLYVTLPVAAHSLGRTIYRRGTQPSKPFVVDESGEILRRPR